jgi:cell division protein FtsL
MRYSNILWFSLCLLAAALLYSVKYQVQAMDSEVASIRQQINEERASLQVLEAEWAFLSRPDRIRQLADKHLDMVPVGGGKLVDMADLRTLGGNVQLASSDGEAVPAYRPGIIQAKGAGYGR